MNLSTSEESRLVFPRSTIEALETFNHDDYQNTLKFVANQFKKTHIAKAINKEQELGYHFESGRYWDHLDEICPVACSSLDRLWLYSLRLE